MRASRLAMGTVVGITVVTDDPAAAGRAIDSAYATIERWEALLSEWRPESLTSELNRTGGPVTFPSEASALFEFVGELRKASGGRFDVTWRGPGELSRDGDAWRLSDGSVDLGSVLKGFLNDRAAETLHVSGCDDFLIDAAGDILAHGDAEQGRGWVVGIEGTRRAFRLDDEALSTSGDTHQPGHILDAWTGEAVKRWRIVSVVAPTGMMADGLATAVFTGMAPRRALRFGGRARWARPGR